MNTLVIYDSQGTIFTRLTGSYTVPVGLPYLEMEVPQGKYVVSVDVTSETHTPIFEDIPPSEMEVLKVENQMLQQSLLETTSYLAQQDERLATQEQALLELTSIIAGGNA